MDPKQAYSYWAEQYDININKTRDLEALAKQEILSSLHFDNCMEIGCGTGKNTQWLAKRAKQVTAVDLSEEMMQKAKEKISSANVEFILADINQEWTFSKGGYDLVTFSLVLEHIQDVEAVFNKAANSLIEGGYVYIGELHPFKQYSGSKARFETKEGEQVVQCYTHHVSEFTKAARDAGLKIERIEEYFDDDDHEGLPRLLCLLLKK